MSAYHLTRALKSQTDSAEKLRKEVRTIRSCKGRLKFTWTFRIACTALIPWKPVPAFANGKL